MEHYNNTEELYHYGVLGMKWGRRRYQNKDGSLTPAGRKRYDDNPSNDQDREVYEKERVARIKSQILDSDDAATIYKNRDLFTTNELQEAYRRLNTEKLIKDLVPREVSKTEKFIKNTTKWSGDIANMLGQGVNLYNNVQKVNNLMKGDQKKDAGNGTDNNSNAGTGKKKKTKNQNAASGGAESIKDAASTAKEVFGKMDRNPVADVAKGVIAKYTSMNTADIKPKYPAGKSISAYASYTKSSPAIQKATSGILSKYSSMNLSSIDTSTRDSGSTFVKNVLDDFDYKFTDKNKK